MIRKLFSSQLRINMVSGVASTAVNVVILMIAYPVYLYFLDYEIYGLWLILATVLNFAQLGNLGIGPAMMKLIAEEHGHNNTEGIRHYYTSAIAILVASGGIALASIVLFQVPIVAAFHLKKEYAEIVLSLLPFVGVLSVYVFLVQATSATLSGLGRMDLANMSQVCGRAVGVVTSIALLWNNLGVYSLFFGSAMCWGTIHLLSLFCIRRCYGGKLFRFGDLQIVSGKHLLRLGGAVCGGSLISMIAAPLCAVLLSRYVGVASLPVFDIARNGSSQIRALFATALKAIVPEISRIGAAFTIDSYARIQQITRKSLWITLLGGGVPFAILMFGAEPLLRLWLRDRYVDELPLAFRIMMVGSYLSLASVPAYFTLLAFARGASLLLASFVESGTTIVLFLLAAVLGLFHDVTIACYAYAIGLGCAALYLTLFARFVLASMKTKVLSAELPSSTESEEVVNSIHQRHDRLMHRTAGHVKINR